MGGGSKHSGGSGGMSDLFAMLPGMASNTPAPQPAAAPPPPPVQVPTKAMPGYAGRPLPLFGQLTPDQLALYNQQHGIAPVKPPPMAPVSGK